MIDWTAILMNLGGFTLLISSITYLFKTLFENFLNRKFLHFEKELERKVDIYKIELDKDLESYKKDLNLKLIKNEKLHQKRLEVLEDFYKKIVELHSCMKDLTNLLKIVNQDFDKEEEERIKNTGNAYNSFLKYYQLHKIYFRPDTCQIIEKLNEGYRDTLWNYTRNSRNKKIYNYEIEEKLYLNMQTEIPKVKEQIEAEFRKYFGES